MDYSVSTPYVYYLSGQVTYSIEDGNIGVVQTMVGELVKKPEHERKIGAFGTIRHRIDGSSSSVRGHAVCMEYRYNHRASDRRHFGKASGINAQHIFP